MKQEEEFERGSGKGSACRKGDDSGKDDIACDAQRIAASLWEALTLIIVDEMI